jgi:DnaJ-class molecular chaperone
MTGDRSDLYAILGLSSQATQGEIRSAYRALMRQNHPDTRTLGDVGDAEAKNTTVRQVIAAYTVLGDPARRAVYDRSTSPPHRMTPTPIHPARRSAQRTPEEPPIRVGPVLWHPN